MCAPFLKLTTFMSAPFSVLHQSLQVKRLCHVDGKMSCGSCHTPHGTVGEKLIGHVSARDNCLSCHADKRGPFLWEHPPATEDCLNCHDPHGSTRESMLVLGLPRLCTSCHGSGHAGSSRTAPTGQRPRQVAPASGANIANFRQMRSWILPLASTSIPASAQTR